MSWWVYVDHYCGLEGVAIDHAVPHVAGWFGPAAELWVDGCIDQYCALGIGGCGPVLWVGRCRLD